MLCRCSARRFFVCCCCCRHNSRCWIPARASRQRRSKVTPSARPSAASLHLRTSGAWAATWHPQHVLRLTSTSASSCRTSSTFQVRFKCARVCVRGVGRTGQCAGVGCAQQFGLKSVAGLHTHCLCLLAAGGGQVYDYQVVFASGKPELRPWSDAVPSFSYNKALPYFQVRETLSGTTHTVSVSIAPAHLKHKQSSPAKKIHVFAAMPTDDNVTGLLYHVVCMCCRRWSFPLRTLCASATCWSHALMSGAAFCLSGRQAWARASSQEQHCRPLQLRQAPGTPLQAVLTAAVAAAGSLAGWWHTLWCSVPRPAAAAFSSSWKASWTRRGRSGGWLVSALQFAFMHACKPQ